MDDRNNKIVTVMLILIWVSMGLYAEIGGPTMLDLRLKFDSNSEEVARSVSAQGVGIFLGAVVAGCFVDTLGTWKILLITAAQLLSTVSIVCMPFVGSLGALWFMFFLLGTAGGIVNVSGQRILLEMWREKSPAPMHALHMGFGIGAVAAPLIANPFLAVLDFNKRDNSSTHNSTEYDFVVVEESRVHLAYVTIGIVSATISLPFFVYPFVKCYMTPSRKKYTSFDSPATDSSTSRMQSLLHSLNPATYAGGSLKFGIFVFIIVGLYFLNLVGGEQLFGNFVRTFSVDQLHFPRNEASYLDTVYWSTFTIGRLLGAVFSHFVHIRTLLLLDVFLNLTAVTLLDIFSASNKTALWIFTAVVGLLIAPLFPAGISYANTQIEVGGVVLTLVVFALGIGELFYIWIEGIIYQKYGPRTILYAMQVSAVLVFIIAVVFVLFTYKRGDRFSEHNSKLVVKTEETEEGNVSKDRDYTQMEQFTSKSDE